jgi:predicted transcriptional regulator
MDEALDDRPTVKSARRVLEILEFFAQGRREATVMEVADALAYPQSSTTALLSSLATLGYLRQDVARRTYWARGCRTNSSVRAAWSAPWNGCVSARASR